MTGMQQALMGGGSRVSFTVFSIGDVHAIPATSSASVAFNSDGSISITGNGSAASPFWIIPPAAGVGANYWVKLVVNSGFAPTGSATNTVLALSANQTWTWNVISGVVHTANCTITVYGDAGGTVVLASSTFAVDVESN